MSFIEIILVLGLPSAVIGGIVSFFIARLQRRIDRDAADRRMQEQTRRQYEMYQVKMITATAALCEANSIALQNGKCNGETHAALDVLTQVKHDQRDFLRSQGIDHLFVKED